MDAPAPTDRPLCHAEDILGTKWTAQILQALLPGVKRFAQIQRDVPGISPKVLAQRLRLLEDRRLVTRKVFATIPPHTEYRLTRLGRDAAPALAAMAAYGALLARDAADRAEPDQPGLPF